MEMYWARICIAAGLLIFAAQGAQAAAPTRTMDLEILANGQLLLKGELIDGIDDLEAKLRVMREREPPFELSIKLPKTFSFASIASVMKMIQDMGLSLGLTGETRKAPPIDPESSTI
jgi:biopolymer transport protein ExbD